MYTKIDRAAASDQASGVKADSANISQAITLGQPLGPLFQLTEPQSIYAELIARAPVTDRMVGHQANP